MANSPPSSTVPTSNLRDGGPGVVGEDEDSGWSYINLLRAGVLPGVLEDQATCAGEGVILTKSERSKF